MWKKKHVNENLKRLIHSTDYDRYKNNMENLNYLESIAISDSE